MSIINDAHLGSVSLFIQSDKASKDFGDAHKFFDFQEIIEPDPHLNMLIGLESFEMPKSFFNLNSFNGILNISIGGSTYNVDYTTIGKNLSASELASQLTTTLSASSVSVSFEEKNNKFTFTKSGEIITILANTTMIDILGVKVGDTGTNTLTSTNIANLSGTGSVYVKINNLGIQNRDSRGQSDGVISKIMVDCNYGNYLFYKNQTQVYYPMSARIIKGLDITLTDDNDNLLELNGGKFSMVLTINFSKIKMRNIPQKFLLDKIKRLEETNIDKK